MGCGDAGFDSRFVVSDIRRLQREFFASNPSLEPMIEMLAQIPGMALFVKDLESRYVRVNAGHLQTYDLKHEDDLVGRAAREFFPDVLAEAYESNDRGVFESGEPVHNEVWLVPHVRGTPRWFISSKSPLFDLKGKVFGLVGFMRPIATPEAQRTHFQELSRVIEFLEDHFVGEITVERLAEIAGISVPHFNRRFRQLLRLSPMEYVLSLRIQEAQRLLSTTDLTIGDIALAAGFYDQSHFTKRFRKLTGLTPLRYRKRFQGRNS
ncbi:MAG: AraC-like DNA-binding protein [Verrucomicrobiales bacterium]